MGIYRQAGSKNWYIRYKDIPAFSTGTTDRKTALQFFDKLKYNYDVHRLLPEIIQAKKHSNLTINELLESYDEHAKVRHRGYCSTTHSAIRILQTYFSGKPAKSLSAKDLRKWQDHMLARTSRRGTPLTPAYVNRVTDELRCAYGLAVSNGDLPEEVLKQFKGTKLKGAVKRLRYLSVDEIGRLIANCSDTLRPIVITALHTGMRRGEILGLTWDRVDLTNNVILLDRTKNGERREMPINATLRAALTALSSRFGGKRVFILQHIKRAFSEALRRSNIVDFRFHDLRHTFASQLVMNEVPLATIQQLLGHKSISMTLRYAHLSNEQSISAVAKLDDIYSAQNTPKNSPKKAVSL